MSPQHIEWRVTTCIMYMGIHACFSDMPVVTADFISVSFISAMERSRRVLTLLLEIVISLIQGRKIPPIFVFSPEF